MIDSYQPLMLMAAWLLYDRFDHVPIGGGRRKENDECAQRKGNGSACTVTGAGCWTSQFATIGRCSITYCSLLARATHNVFGLH